MHQSEFHIHQSTGKLQVHCPGVAARDDEKSNLPIDAKSTALYFIKNRTKSKLGWSVMLISEITVLDVESTYVEHFTVRGTAVGVISSLHTILRLATSKKGNYWLI